MSSSGFCHSWTTDAWERQQRLHARGEENRVIKDAEKYPDQWDAEGRSVR